MLRPRLIAPRFAASLGLRATLNARRTLHSVPDLKHDLSQGVPEFMSPAGFSLAWNDYQGLVVEKLNALTAGSELEDIDTKTVSFLTAREPSQAPIFNYASMAHNNHFYFQGVKPGGTPMGPTLKSDLELSFSSIDTLRQELIVTASAMFGPGFVWLVRTGPREYKVLATYLAGSPYSGAHWRRQGSDMNTLGKDGSASEYYQNRVDAKRRSSTELPPGGISVEPVLCLNTWEHAWLLDWGTGKEGRGGKTAFAEAWWNNIDWQEVANRAGIKEAAPQTGTAEAHAEEGNPVEGA